MRVSTHHGRGEPTPIAGRCDPRFAAVRDAFANNFAAHDELGAAVCVTVDGRVVVDLWGGYVAAVGTRQWGPDTLVNAFSVGKGMLALVVARLVGDGRLALDRAVAACWPEFAAAGKAEITVRQLLTHEAGLPALRSRLAPGAMLDWRAMTTALAAETPWWEPGTAHGYHTNTFGFLVGEVIRRVTGDTPGATLHELVTGPLGADVHLGLAAGHDPRVAEFVWPVEPPPETEPPDLDDVALMRFNAYFNPSGLSGAGVVNTRAWRAAEIPSTNLHASARGVAGVYRALAAGGIHDGVRVVDRDALAAAARPQVSGLDLVLDRASRFGVGFQLTQPERPLGPNPGTFGHFGAGGSLGYCDPIVGVGFGYVMNQLGARWQNPRNRALVDAVYASL